MSANNNLTIKDWSIEDRPREKMLANGVKTLTDAELLAILIATGNKEHSALDLARMVLKSVGGSLDKLGKSEIAKLMEVKGIGEAKAITIMAAMELGLRRKRSEVLVEKIEKSVDVYNLMHPVLCALKHEEMWVLYLNNSNKVIDKQRISLGGINATVVDTRLVMKHAIEKLASGLVLVHNHPSGINQPSDSDAEVTREIKLAANYFRIKLLDHIIVTDNAYYSFADENKL